jgi:hypothetical protein
MYRESIFLDPVNAGDFLKLNPVYACEDCSHYDDLNRRCTIGFNSKNHERQRQLEVYELTGRMALCRFLEID